MVERNPTHVCAWIADGEVRAEQNAVDIAFVDSATEHTHSEYTRTRQVEIILFVALHTR